MEKPFESIWQKTMFRNRKGYMLEIDNHFNLFLFEDKNRHYQYQLLFGANRKVLTYGICAPRTERDEAARGAIQHALTYMHRQAVAMSYGATNLRVLSGVPDAGLQPAAKSCPATMNPEDYSHD